MKRAATAWSSGPSSSHAGTHDGRGESVRGVALAPGLNRGGDPVGQGALCTFSLANNGTAAAAAGDGHPNAAAAAYLSSDVYRVSAAVDADGWHVVVPNALAAVPFGVAADIRVAVGAAENAAPAAVVTLTAASESDPSVVATARCSVSL